MRADTSADPAVPATQRLHVDWTRCDGHGSCVELLPELLEADEWGYPIVRPGLTGSAREDVPVPAGLEEHARAAVAACPLMALRLRGAPAAAGPGPTAAQV